MRVLVVGAAGKTGRAVVEQAMKQGHQVTAFVHSATSSGVPDVEVRVGDASDMATMQDALLGQDAVIEAVGGKAPYKRTTLEARAAATMVEAMQRHGVRRLIATSMFGAGESAANAPFYMKVLLATLLRGEVPDKSKKESIITSSELDWVIVRPPFLTDKPATGDVRILPVHSRDPSRDHPLRPRRVHGRSADER